MLTEAGKYYGEYDLLVVARGPQWFVQCDPYGLRRRALALGSTLSPADLDAGLAHRPQLTIHQQKVIPLLQPGQLPAAWFACSHLPAYAYPPFAELLRRQPLIRRRGAYTIDRWPQPSDLTPHPLNSRHGASRRGHHWREHIIRQCDAAIGRPRRGGETAKSSRGPPAKLNVAAMARALSVALWFPSTG